MWVLLVRVIKQHPNPHQIHFIEETLIFCVWGDSFVFYVCVSGYATKEVRIRTGCKSQHYYLVIKILCLIQNIWWGRNLFKDSTRVSNPERPNHPIPIIKF